MITEDYVSFEIAKLLKEKGFDGLCYKVWESHDDSQTLVGAPWLVNRESVDAAAKQYTYDLDDKVEGYLAPTLQMAMKWLREEKHIFIELLVDTMIKGAFTWRLFEYPSLEIMPYDGWEYTYEKACETAIKYCLENLI